MKNEIMIEYLTYDQMEEKVNTKGHVVINVTADWCTQCENFKKDLPELIDIAFNKGINIYNIKMENGKEEFFNKYNFQLIPYTLIFTNSQYVGGNIFDKKLYISLLDILSEIKSEELLK